jgi:hypothetical protein
MPSLRRHPNVFYLYVGLFLSALSLLAGIAYRSPPMLVYALVMGTPCILALLLILRRD